MASVTVMIPAGIELPRKGEAKASPIRQAVGTRRTAELMRLDGGIGEVCPDKCQARSP
jgi:hypothetical protein